MGASAAEKAGGHVVTNSRGSWSEPTGLGPLFAVLWALALISHVWNQGSGVLGGEPLSEAHYWVVLLAGALVLWRPRSGLTFVLLSAAAVVSLLWRMPTIANHWYLVGLVSAGFLVSAWRVRNVRPFSTDEIVAAGAPVARTLFLLGYSAAAFAKLNATFFDPARSCAVYFGEDAASFWGLALPSSTVGQQAVAWGVAGIELAIPLLLLVRRTRPLGVATAAVFHVAMASTPVVLVLDFTAILIALVVLFVPTTLVEATRRGRAWMLPRVPNFRAVLGRGWVRGLLLALLVAAVGLRGLLLPNDYFAPLAWMALLGWWALISLLLVAALIWHAVAVGSPSEPVRLRPSGPGHWLLVALVVLMAVSPYVGLRTGGAFTMFSNLRTEQGMSNHLLVPGADGLGLQHAYVQVLDTTDEYLQSTVDNNELVHELELRRRLSEDPDQPVRFRQGQRTVELERADDREDLVRMSFVERRLLHFRSIPAEGSPRCRH